MKHTAYIVILSALLYTGISLGGSQKADSGPTSVAIDDATCRSCHKAEVSEVAKTRHSNGTCEKCHGSGKAHVDAEQAAHGDDKKTAAANKLIFSFKGTSKENSDRCLSCHISGKLQQSFAHSEHATHGVSCNACHSAHLVNETRDQSKGTLPSVQARVFQVFSQPSETQWLQNSLLKSAQPTLCYSCHGTVQAQFAMPVHHRVPEGLMKCSDCHNTHGTSNHASLIKSTSETCVQCHTEKRGPFVHEHPAGKIDGCVTCHNPHGSVNRNLLIRREARQLCLQCHTGIHSQTAVPHSRLSFQTSGECVRCHVTIHGSNFDTFFLR